MPLAISHPPVDDLTCASEPDAPVVPPVGAGDTAWAAFDQAALAFDRKALLAGRSCRDALGRVCRWHKARGAQLECQ